MSVNAAFSIFKPNNNALFRGLSSVRDDGAASTASLTSSGSSSRHLFLDDASVASSSDHHDGKLSVLSEELDALDDDGDNGHQLRDVDDDLGLLTDQVRELTAEKAALLTRLEALDARAAQLEREKHELQLQQGSDKELADLIAVLAAEKTDLQRQNATLQQRIDVLEVSVTNARAATEAAKKEAAAAAISVESELKAELEAARAEVAASRKEAEAARVEAETAREAVNASRAEAEAARAEAQAALAEAASAVAREQEELASADQKKAAAEDELVGLINELTAERDRLLNQNEVLERQKDALQRSYDELEAQPRVDDELATLVSGMAAKNDELQKQNEELQAEVDEVYDLLEQMSEHVESLEIHQHSLVTYANKVCTDVKNVKRRGVWQKIEWDKERQLLVEELYQWKRKAEELTATQKDALVAAEAKAAWEAACLNQTIEQLEGQVLTIKTELDATKEELSRRGGSAEEIAETEQMLEAVQELALDLKKQLDESNLALEEQKALAAREIQELQDTLRDVKQRKVKDDVAHDKERQVLMEEILLLKNRVLEASDSTQSEPESALSTDGLHDAQDSVAAAGDDIAEKADLNDNQTEHEPVKDVEMTQGAPVSTASESSNQSVASAEKAVDTPAKDTDAGDVEVGNQADSPKKPQQLPNITELLEQDDEEDDRDQVSEPVLLSPKREDSFFGLLRSFSFRSRSESMASSHGQEPESTPQSRSRANSTASSTTSTASSTKRAKAKAAAPPPPVTQYTRNDFLRQQEPHRMNSFKHFL